MASVKTGEPSSPSRNSLSQEHDLAHELPPLPTIPKTRARTITRRNLNVSTPVDSQSSLPETANASTTTPFSPLSKTASRASQVSVNRSFVDPVGFVGFTDLKKVETRTITVGKASLALDGDDDPSGKGDIEEGEVGKEIEVAVQVTPDGTEFTFPDGGLEAYLVLAGGVCAAFSAFGMAAATGGFQTYYRTTLLPQYSSGQLAWIGATQAFVCFFTSVFTGPLFDMYGHKPLVAGGTVMLVFGFCMLSLCSQYYQVFICHALLISMGMDLLFIAPIGVVGQWFFLRRGMAFGILMTGSSAGAMIWPTIMANLPQIIGFGWTCRLIGLITGILGIASYFLMKTRLPPKPPGPFFYPQAFKKWPYIWICCSYFTFVFGFFSFMFFIGTYGQLVGLGTLAPYLLIITNGSSGVGRVIGGIAADRLGPHNVSILGDFVMVILMFTWLGLKSAGGLITLCVIYGLASGPYISLQAPLVTCHADDSRYSATMVGQALVGQSFAQLIGPPIFGIMTGTGSAEEQLANFPHAIILGSLMLFLSMSFLIVNKFLADRNIWARV